MRKVVVNSFHSQAVEFILEYEPFELVCLDGHMDTAGLGGSMGDRELLGSDELFYIYHRASTHTLLAKSLVPNLCGVTLVVPEKGYTTHLVHMYEQTETVVPSEQPLTIVEKARRAQPVCDQFLSMLGIQMLLSPPSNLLSIRKRFGGEGCALDIDVDYIHEFQSECYTPLRGAELGDLGFLERVIMLVKKTRPEFITVSEARIASIKSDYSVFSAFINKLKALGYSIELGKLFNNDEEAELLLRLHEEFMKFKYPEIARQHFIEELSQENLERQRKETIMVFKTFSKNRLSGF
jgi:hypothetical protein